MKRIKVMCQQVDEKEKKVEGVIFIQYTPYSEVAKAIRSRLKDIEKICKIKIKIVEKTGDKLVDILHKSDPWSKQDCMREDCWPCNSSGENEKNKGSCRKRSILYETYCELCGEIEVDVDNKINSEIEGTKRKRDIVQLEQGIMKGKKRKDYKVKYIGESWRTAYERGIEHQDDLKNLRVNSHMLKHILEEHPTLRVDEVKFGMRVKLQFKSALERQNSL